MEHPPSDLLEILPVGAAPVAEQWWSTLSDAERTRIAGLWDERLEVKFFTPQNDEDGHLDVWGQVPAVTGGRFVPSDDDGRSEWEPGYFEHLIQHPELMLAYDPIKLVFFYFCTRHPAAQTCLKNGAVPADFSCPFNDANCPMKPLRGAQLTDKHSRTLTALP